MTDNIQHPTAAAALRLADDELPAMRPAAKAARALAGDYEVLLFWAAHPPSKDTGTIGRSGDVHAIPGGVVTHDLRREVRDTAFAYAETVADLRDLNDRALGDVLGNLRLIATHADALDHADPAVRADTTPTGETVTRPACPVEHRRQIDGQWRDDTPEDHLRCLAHRVRVHLEPPGAREFVGPCPSPLVEHGTTYSAETCGLDLRAYDHGPARCPAGHVHDTATVRDQSLTASRDHLLTLRQIHDGSLLLLGKRVPLKTLRTWVTRGRLTPRGETPDGAALVHTDDVRALVA